MNRDCEGGVLRPDPHFALAGTLSGDLSVLGSMSGGAGSLAAKWLQLPTLLSGPVPLLPVRESAKKGLVDLLDTVGCREAAPCFRGCMMPMHAHAPPKDKTAHACALC